MNNFEDDCILSTDLRIEDVYRALTDPESLVKWFLPSVSASARAAEGDSLILQSAAQGIDIALITPDKKRRQVTFEGLPDLTVTTTCKLDEENGSAKIRVSLNAIDLLPGDAEKDRSHFCIQAWDKAMQRLRYQLEGKGQPDLSSYCGPLFGYWKETRGKLAVERSTWIAAPRESTWYALTAPETYQTWLSPAIHWSLSGLNEGGRFYVYDPKTRSELYAQVIEQIKVPQAITLRNVPAPIQPTEYQAAYSLINENGGTRLTVTHSGYEQDPEEKRWTRMEQISASFGLVLMNIKAYVEGEPLPFPQGFGQRA